MNLFGHPDFTVLFDFLAEHGHVRHVDVWTDDEAETCRLAAFAVAQRGLKGDVMERDGLLSDPPHQAHELAVGTEVLLEDDAGELHETKTSGKPWCLKGGTWRVEVDTGEWCSDVDLERIWVVLGAVVPKRKLRVLECPGCVDCVGEV